MNKERNKSSVKTLVEVHQFREIFYLFLSRSFSREVDKTFLKSAIEISNSLKDFFRDFKENSLNRGRQLLESFFQEIKQIEENIVLKDLAKDYAFLFLGVGRENVSLCESAYRSQRGLLFQGAYFEIMEEYRKVGLTKRENFHEPEDHLSIELVYMANLCHWSISSIEKRKKKEIEQYYSWQRSFLHDHLMQWIPSFAKGLLETSPSKFYKALAYLLKGYIKMDYDLIDSLLPETGTSKASSRRKSKNQKEGGENRLALIR